MKKSVCLLCALLCLAFCMPPAGAANGCFVMNVDTLDLSRLNQDAYVQQYLSAQAQGLEVVKQLPEGSVLPVRLSLVRMDAQQLVFDKDYGYQSGTFSSGSLYLPYVGNYTVPYLATLYVGDTVYAIPFMHLQSRLQNNGACTWGAYLYDYHPTLGRDWHMGTMLDLDALRTQGILAVDVCASNSYLIGQANIIMQDGMICVVLNLNQSAGVEVHSQEVYLATDCTRLLAEGFGEPCQPGEWIYVGDAASALLYLPMTISYNPDGLPGFHYDLSHGYLEQQLELWRENCGF